MLALLPLVVLFVAQEPGFGGAGAATATPPAPEQPPVDDSPGQAELRARLATTLRDNTQPAEATNEARKRTKLEEEIERAHLDPTLPLIAFRIEVARAELEVEELTTRLARPEVVRVAEDNVAQLHDISDLVERIALARLVKCTRAIGEPITVKNWRMTAGGPVELSAKELIEQVPNGDPPDCERVTLMDAETMASARRLFALRVELKTRTFGYFDVAERKRLEAERTTLERALGQQALSGTWVSPPR